MPHTLVLLRHGNSEWNQKNLFTGWVDVRLSELGETEAARAGELLRESGLLPDVQHTSVLTRAIQTANIALDVADRAWIDVRRILAAQRAPLRRAAGPRQGRDAREVRPRAVHAVAPLVRRAAARARRRRRVVAGRRPALRGPRRRRDAAHRVPEGRHRAHAALLAVRHHPRPRAPARPCSSPRTATRCVRS